MSVRKRISETRYSKFARYSEHVACSRGLVLLWWHYDTLRTSSIVDVTFLHNGHAYARRMWRILKATLPRAARIRYRHSGSLGFRTGRGGDDVCYSLFDQLCHKYVINKQRCSNNRRINFFSNRIVNLWNNLPSRTTDFTSFRKFDKSLNNDYFLLYCKLNFT